jgi:tRNA (mo5U34)-methyltransferase
MDMPVCSLQDRVNALRWFHSIDLGDGLITPGLVDRGYLQSCADAYFSGDIAGKTVLDIGCWDGFNSVEAVRRGAARVLAADHWVWANHPWASRQTIELVREAAAPSMDVLDIDIPAIGPDTVGTFDVVLFCGILYHLQNMLAGLERVASVTRQMLVVETHLDAEYLAYPAAIFYPEGELNGDGSNWWGPNRLCVESMLRSVGFQRIEFTRPANPSRGIFRAWR